MQHYAGSWPQLQEPIDSGAGYAGMVRWFPAGSPPRLASITLLAWGAAEVALRLRLAMKPGWRERLRAWSVGPGGKLREWTFFLLVLAIGGAVVGAMWLSRLTRFATGGASVIAIVGEVVAVA